MKFAKALIGERTGELIDANEFALNHEICRSWKIYCRECKQFVYFSKSEQLENRSSYFGHYDYEDKNCSERAPRTKQQDQKKSLSESHEQDLQTAESFVERFFYGIDPDYFKNPSLNNNPDFLFLSKSSLEWFKGNFHTHLQDWVRHYCINIGFLGWDNPNKETNYLLDWLYVLARREDLLESISHYFATQYLQNNVVKSDTYGRKFGVIGSNEEEKVWLLALITIIESLASMLKSGNSYSQSHILQTKIFVEVEIPPSPRKPPFRGKLSRSYLPFSRLPIKIRETQSGNFSEFIIFDDQLKNHFWYVGSDELDWRDKCSESNSLVLFIDGYNKLAVQGTVTKKYAKVMIKGISKVLFNRTEYSMLMLLRQKYISQEIAEKAAQSALLSEYGFLSPSEAFLKFRTLSGW